jgi:translation initiation factor eIF-2B subunit delta
VSAELVLGSSSVVVLLGRGAAALAVLARAAALARVAGDAPLRIVVVESAVHGEAMKTLRTLLAAGVERVSLAPFSSLCAAVSDATLVLLSAVDVFADGSLVGRAGTAVLAAAARAENVPVVACVESFKFVDRTLASPDAASRNEVAAASPPPAPPAALPAKGASPAELLAAVPWVDAPAAAPSAPPAAARHCAPLFDVTPAALITAFFTDATNALVPPRAVGAIARSNAEVFEDEQADAGESESDEAEEDD